ncbi:Sulfotransferase domain-containing protein [Aliiroseovarius sediminilitoris]|uniref:Sulfotransferase domain-containing protein n=1 Tax=Aliiroseovarius sediminilitoris TaxID=1173584 RepID=A0A1I0MMN3_9RHOB|nr:sulfotransferase domain-containing protein [Aliiroseovarius sediminilitoris]SEV88895.1 Sulfotransferase domain-containing protein [Aliiroseovarius sediminilitoris]
MPKIFLHIGTHKTGSTSIQEAFQGYDDGQTIYADLGFANHSIPVYTAYSGRHQRYHIWRGAGSEAKERLRIESKKNIASFLDRVDRENIIISGEDISQLPEEGLIEFHNELKKVSSDIEVIVYVRNPVSFMTSDMQEFVKSGQNMAKPVSPNYRPRIEKFIRHFGRENVNIREFSPEVLKNGDIVQDFSEVIGVDTPGNSRRTNVSLSTDALRVVYLTNQLISVGAEADTILAARKKFIEHVRLLLPGKFVLPPALIAPLVDQQDIDWLYSVSSIDFRTDQEQDKEFDPKELRKYMSQPVEEALDKIRNYLIDAHRLKSPPADTRFLIARYFMAFLNTTNRPNVDSIKHKYRQSSRLRLLGRKLGFR